MKVGIVTAGGSGMGGRRDDPFHLTSNVRAHDGSDYDQRRSSVVHSSEGEEIGRRRD
jgi:hypothetical protein